MTLHAVVNCFRLASKAALLGAMMTLNACAIGPTLENHTFEFDVRRDSPDVEVLAYRYGTSKMTHSDLQLERYGAVKQSTSVNGPMPRGDSLFVRWRIKATSDVFEETVDLHDKLPYNLRYCRIVFVVRGARLFVYLVHPQKRLSTDSPSPFKLYSDLKVTILHPTSSDDKAN